MIGARWLALSLVVVGCAEPVVEMSLQMPDSANGGSFDTSCITAIEVIAYGIDYPDQPNDFTRQCLEVDSAPATYADVRRVMAGQFSLRMPPSRLASIEIAGRLGDCGIQDPEDYAPDIVFYGGVDYRGEDEIMIPLGGRLSCAMQPITVQPLDILKLASAPADCAAAALPDDPDAYVDIGTISKTLYGPRWFGDSTYAKLAGGVATMTARLTTTTDACIGISAYSGELDTTTCAVNNQRLCGGPTHFEVATLPYAVWDSLIDPVRAAAWETVNVGAVWTSGASKAPIQGATVRIDAELGEVEYVEPGPTVTRNLAGTGRSGLFVLYADSLVDVEIDGAGVTRTVTLGAPVDFSNNISLVVMK
jgi:hypothetical protein